MVICQQQMLVLHLPVNRVFALGASQNRFHQLKWTGESVFGFLLQRKKKKKQSTLERRPLKFIVTAQLSNSFSLSIGFNSQATQKRDLSQSHWIGPLPGDIAEVEAYCRIFRAAEWFHNSLMDTLCNPLTGECSISYDIPSEDKPLLEEKIVSVLGCMVCLLNKGREDVLSGRSSVRNAFRESDVNLLEDSLPPLAVFRGEMKRYCESLHVALEGYLTPDDTRSMDVWRKLQKLKNACYDSGFPRQAGDPCHTLFANWNPVYLSAVEDNTDSDSEVAFWRGGQVTEEGLKWLFEKGFRTIVDLRAESVKDIFYEKAIRDAALTGKIQVVKLPVEVGTAPSMSQVEHFASLVLDSRQRPIYLHSREGVWRTSAMVSRWRQYIARSRSQIPSRQAISSPAFQSRDTRKTEEADISQNIESATVSDAPVSNPEDMNETCSLLSGVANGNHQASDHSSFMNNGVSSDVATNQEKELPINEQGVDVLVNFYPEVNPLESQLPPGNFLSKKEMSEFLRTRKISPLTYFTHEKTRLQKISALIYNSNGSTWRNEYNGNYNGFGTYRMEGSNGSLTRKKSSSKPVIASGDGKMMDLERYGNYSSSFSNGSSNGHSTTTAGRNDFPDSKSKLDKGVISSTKTAENQRNNDASLSVLDNELEVVEGNMCASATGVVRVQSRRKAEMFLVRTDGFSCSREKVTESSLAFTHPSTQQQMLMWKSPPKTVLLLKKLGQELMEEAKEVASFLYYQEKMSVLVEPELHDIFARIPGFGFVQTFYSQDTSDLHERVDFVACLGGDGVILHASNIFRDAVPPVVSFNLGSLGFLTSHAFEDYKKDLRQIIHGNDTVDGVYITLRMRLRCEIFRNGKAMPGKVFDVLNEVVVDRGSNPYLSKIECYEHDRLITKVQGDGVIVATPTGSTAYSTAAGGSMACNTS
ncbi:OLC1v1016396C1 [Oldenlandia corymbosa var. corymbosa]|uniref:OLC1v1016396C1 n=1 Tax=Oldenlandia corymbosa var. corymbosa TaxID=529605 RepID=A0AAV1E6U1_OLDCO|nr:OLC1v1016396C1 [Oldenlandia corymbosa var. corymbosa]